MPNIIRNLIYGEPDYNLEIKPMFDEAELNKMDLHGRIKEYLIHAQEQGYKKGYFGSHIVTKKGFLIQGEDKTLPQKVIEYDLLALSGAGDILNLDIVYRNPPSDEHGFMLPQFKPIKMGRCKPHIHLEGRLYDINKTWRGLQLV